MHRVRIVSAILACCLLVSCAGTRSVDLSGMSFSEEPLLGKAVWHDLISEDLDAARRFYGGLFGWTFETGSSRSGRDYLLARKGDVYVAGMLGVAREEDKAVSRWLPYLSVSNVDSAADRVAAAGGSIIVGPRDVPLGRVAAISDEEGAVVGIARSSVGDPDDRTTAGAVGRVVWNELLANDTANSARFYERVFGYQARAIERRGGSYIVLHASGSERAGILQNPENRWDPLWLTYFGVADPAAAAARVPALGGQVVLPPSPGLREGTMAVVTDPSGAILVLQKWPE